MATIFLMNEEIARGMVCFFHQKKHSYLIIFWKNWRTFFHFSNSFKSAIFPPFLGNLSDFYTVHRKNRVFRPHRKGELIAD
jgi:hypothetical protein